MSSELKAQLDKIADSVTLNPAAAGVKFMADSRLTGVCEVDTRIRTHHQKVDEPEALGGADVAPNPVEYALLALGSCHAITYRFWSEKLGIQLDRCEVDVHGDLDVRGVFGLDDGVRPGFGQVEVRVTMGGPESPERYEELRRIADEHCPVLDIFEGSVPVKRSLTLD